MSVDRLLVFILFLLDDVIQLSKHFEELSEMFLPKIKDAELSEEHIIVIRWEI